MKNEDSKCFMWFHVRHLKPQDRNPQRIKKDDKKFAEELNYEGINFAVSQKQYNKVEKQNDIRINIFGYEGGEPYPIYISKEKYEDHMELLLITDDDNKHYVLMDYFNSFMNSQSKHIERKHFCMYCLQCFKSKETLERHVERCLTINGTQAINMPKEGENFLHFRNFHKKIPVPFVRYADFEAITRKVQGCKQEDTKDRGSYTEAYQVHEDCGYCYKVVSCYDDKFKDENDFFESTECHICGEKYEERCMPHRDACQVTGKYLGSSHKVCSLKTKITPDKLKIPVVFHNLRGYDSHFIMQQIGRVANEHAYTNDKGEKKNLSVNLIPNNMEKYMTFMLGNHLTFIDSFQFMSSSLEKLVDNLPRESFKYTSQQFDEDKLDLMIKKGVYPYDYMDSFDRFFERRLPSKESFHSTLYNQGITDKEYEHAQQVWNTFGVGDIGQYHNLYLASDVLLLADVFENFRKTCLQFYDLDPCHYFTSPGLSWDAMLKMTNIDLELMTDIDMFQFIEKGMRGGVSYIANRYGRANNKYMSNYNENEPSKYIMYLDANNLYSWAMSQYLPTGNFKWLTDKEIDRLNLDTYQDNSDRGLILEVDLEYSKNLHDLHNNYPLAPETFKVTSDMLSKYCKDISEKYKISTGLVNKLIPTLCDKEKYVLHYQNLLLYQYLGLKVTKIHRATEFDQSPWLKQYIDFNTNKRKQAKNPFEKDFFKSMNNSVFGKTVENLRK